MSEHNPAIGAVITSNSDQGLPAIGQATISESGSDIEAAGIRRRFIADDIREEWDEHGFLDLANTPAWTVGPLLEHAPVIVWGQPWLGKTFVSRQLASWLLSGHGGNFDGRVWRSTFEGPDALRGSLLPL